jgi:endonuclease-3 related protein
LENPPFRRSQVLLPKIFESLFRTYGPQNWWPGESPFEVIVGAILTQNTNWRNVEAAIKNLAEEDLLSPKAIERITMKRLSQLVRPSGYYNVKAKRLKEFTRYIVREYSGDFRKMRRRGIEILRKEILTIKGIGQETGDTILLYGLKKPIFVVDTYTKRILFRHGLIGEGATYEEIQDLFNRSVKKDVKRYNEFHALLVRLGKERCRRKNPLCSGCPIEGIGGNAVSEKEVL